MNLRAIEVLDPPCCQLLTIRARCQGKVSASKLSTSRFQLIPLCSSTYLISAVGCCLDYHKLGYCRSDSSLPRKLYRYFEASVETARLSRPKRVPFCHHWHSPISSRQDSTQGKIQYLYGLCKSL